MLKALASILILLTVAPWFNLPSAKAMVRSQLAVGLGQFCKLESNQIKCWGSIYKESDSHYHIENLSFRTMSSMLSIFFADDNNLCGHTYSEVRCLNSDLFKDVGMLRTIKSVSAFENKGCVVSIEGLTCSGNFLFDWRNFAFDLNSPKDVAVGEAHICVIDGSSVLCTGDKTSWRNLGQAEPPKRYFNNPTRIVAGRFHTCVLDDDGVTCWGDTRSNKIKPPASLKEVSRLSAGHNHTCALDKNGVTCWGERFGARLDVPNLENPSLISAGPAATCAEDKLGVRCWGRSTVEAPIQLAHYSGVIEQLALGDGFSCSLDQSKEANCWGRYITPTSGKVLEIVSGKSFACFRFENGVDCKSTFDEFNFVELTPPISNVTNLFAGEKFACLRAPGNFECWGENANRQLSIPSQLKQQSQKIKHISLGGVHACASIENKIHCWGAYTCDARKRPCWATNHKGELDAPQGLKRIESMAAGTEHTCVLADGLVQCWGGNQNGQIDVPELTNPKRVLAKGSTSCAVDGEDLICWGQHQILSTKTSSQNNSKLRIKNPDNLYLGHGHACYSDNLTTSCWGLNYSGQALAPSAD